MKSIRVLCLFLAFMFIVAGCRKKRTGTITPLHQAAQAGDIDKVRILISEGADVNAKDEFGITPLHEAAQYEYGHKDVVELLVTKGANVDAKTKQGQTALDLAYDSHRADIVEFLKSVGGKAGDKNLRKNGAKD